MKQSHWVTPDHDIRHFFSVRRDYEHNGISFSGLLFTSIDDAIERMEDACEQRWLEDRRLR